jgi:hypothetical protein
LLLLHPIQLLSPPFLLLTLLLMLSVPVLQLLEQLAPMLLL